MGLSRDDIKNATKAALGKEPTAWAGEFSLKEIKDTPWKDLPNVIFNDAPNSRSQRLAIEKHSWSVLSGFITPKISYLPKDLFEAVLKDEQK